MFVNKVMFLVTVGAPMRYIMVSHITSKKSGVLKAELLKHQAKYIKQGFKVRSLFCDGESGVGAIIPDIEINKIDVQIAGPETHIGRVEVAIKYLKQMARSIIASLDYKLSSSLIVWLIYHVASRSNFVPISTLSETITPREYMLGRQLDYKLDLQLKFGERVEVHQRSDNSMSPRTRPGIALVSTGNLYGSWKVLMLDTMKIATMDAWTPVASLPKEDIDLMNKLAESKGSQPLSTKLEFELAGGRPVGDDLNPEDYEQLMHLPEARRDREIVPTDEPDFTEETPEVPAATTFEAEPSVGGADVPMEPVQSEERQVHRPRSVRISWSRWTKQPGRRGPSAGGLRHPRERTDGIEFRRPGWRRGAGDSASLRGRGAQTSPRYRASTWKVQSKERASIRTYRWTLAGAARIGVPTQCQGEFEEVWRESRRFDSEGANLN
jgi:hypothetical protein